jgi:hypothetical protein
MDGRRSWLGIAAVLSLVGACGGQPLDDGAASNTGGAPPPATSTGGQQDTTAALRSLVGPNTLMVVGSNAGAVARAPSGDTRFFPSDPGTLVTAAGTVDMHVCSVEPQTLADPGTGAGAAGMTVDAALAACDQEDLGDMLERLRALRTDQTVVIIAANTGITDRSTNGGINFFYDADIVRLLHAARKLYVTACVIAPDSLALPTPQGQTPGLSVDQALARCGD